MGEIVNLRKARKQVERRLDDTRAAKIASSTAAPKSERNLEAARKAKARREHDQHRVETGDER